MAGGYLARYHRDSQHGHWGEHRLFHAAYLLALCELLLLAPGRSLDVVGDQALAGATLWVVGSMLYVSSIVLVLNRLFIEHGEGGPAPAPDWDDDDRMIMPGLEHRLRH